VTQPRRSPDPSDLKSAPLDFRHPAEKGLVSCIVPVYNGERFVGECVESILRQSYGPIEVIVVDDGSHDGTLGTLRPFGDRVRIFQQENQGPSVARNRGVEESRGEYVAFLDADDLWVEDKIESQMDRFRARPELDLCSGHIKSFWIPELDHERIRVEDHPYHQERALLSPCTVLVKRRVFELLGGFDPELRNGEDTDWFMRMMKAGVEYETLPRLLVNRRQHSNNLTRHHRPSQEAVLGHLKRVLDRGRAAQGS
jgi:glycosyltransferase involved in cell wall biosynthesis